MSTPTISGHRRAMREPEPGPNIPAFWTAGWVALTRGWIKQCEVEKRRNVSYGGFCRHGTSWADWCFHCARATLNDLLGPVAKGERGINER